MSTLLINSEAEFTDHNKRGLAWALARAYAEADAHTDAEKFPSFATPLRPSIRGSVRWNHVQANLKLACETGQIKGFIPMWRSTGGKSACNQVLELVGEHCTLTAAHTSELDETPREAAFRRDARCSNQLVLQSIEEQLPQAQDKGGKVSLLLVHGGHSFDFAEVRCYNGGEDNRSAYATVVAKLEDWREDEDGGSLAWAEQEPIISPTLTLRAEPGAEPGVIGN